MPSPALFAWEGFSFRHPDDWAPVSLSGARAEGYVRLQGPGRIGAQVRWKKVKPGVDLAKTLDAYFKLLERDAKKAKLTLSLEREERDGRHIYRHIGANQGRGAALSTSDGRIFMIETIGGRTDSLLPHYRALIDSFASDPEGDLEAWALFGMELKLPKGLSPSVKTLQSGRTWLTFRLRGARIEVGRYAFGGELVARHGLENWAKAALRMPGATASFEEGGVRLDSKTKLIGPPISALVRLDEPRNQLVAIRSESKSPKWKPEWHWLD